MNLSPLPKLEFLDNNGRPLVGGKLFTYAAGTNDKITTYTDSSGLSQNTNPIELDYRGECDVWLDPTLAYKYVLAPPTDTDPPTNPIWTIDNIIGALTIADITQQFLGRILYPRTVAEDSAGATIINYWYPPGYVYRYGTNANPGTTDMTVAINTAANVCRAGRYVLMLPPETCLVSSTLDFSGIRVDGQNQEQGPNILATSAQFDVIRSTGSSSFNNFGVRGGWDGVTAGQNGDVFSLIDPGDGFAYTISFFNVNISFAKKRGIYWEGGGYGSIYRVQCYSSGLHGLELYGPDAAHATTTIWIGGQSVFTTTPNGYGAKLTNCIEVKFSGVTMESTRGIQVNGNDNRSLSFDSVYQEFGSGSFFLDLGTSGGIGLSISNCIGGGKAVSDPTNWTDVYYPGGNALLTQAAVPFANRILENTGAEGTTSTAGGVSVTASQVSAGIGTWKVTGEFQTADAGGLSATMTLACRLTTNPADSGLANQTNVNFVVGADTIVGAGRSNRAKAYQIFRLTSPATIYLRGFMDFAAGTAGYKGHLYAELVQ